MARGPRCLAGITGTKASTAMTLSVENLTSIGVAIAVNDQPMIELTYNYDVTSYELGNGFGHVAIGVRDIYAVCESLRSEGVRIVREPGPVQFGTVHIAFVDDPDGYRIELIDIDTGDYAGKR